ncbi:MAG: 23S rRNA (adenine(2503)-C(2))-methyltransferase RlmN, partial [Candidatus Competibacteraceae bacterium]|nr:23S rRNA (adenine(2503)-C(2))-methyltransferase RlmN [Candidatus Competibacteraceae bacterium]
MSKLNLLDLNRAELEAYFLELGEKRFRAEQIMKWIYHENVTDLAAMSNLSKALRTRLEPLAEIRLPR